MFLKTYMENKRVINWTAVCAHHFILWRLYSSYVIALRPSHAPSPYPYIMILADKNGGV